MSAALAATFRTLSLRSAARSLSSTAHAGASSLPSASAPSPSPPPPAAPSTAPPTASTWTPITVRTGVLARKKGMTALWDPVTGARIPVTLLHLDAVQVISSQTYPGTKTSRERHSVIVGCTARRPKNVHNALKGQFAKAGVECKMRLAEWSVSKDALVESGTTISAAHFVPGQYVDVQAPSIGKGFQGPMKRHGFKGLRASHGVSVSHRSHGSTGQHQDPGRVFPGKKMAGRMGGTNVTTQNLLVYRVDTHTNTIFVKGCVPGSKEAFVRVSDAGKKVGWNAGERAKKGLFGLSEGVQGLPVPVGKVGEWEGVVEVGR